MKIRFLLSALLALVATATAAQPQNCGCGCCKDKPNEPCCCAPTPASAAKSEVKRHPLRGVITAVHADKSAIMVKHEEIPGVMRAMTMLFKVDPAVVKTLQKGQAITGLMSRVNDEWRLDEVKPTS